MKLEIETELKNFFSLILIEDFMNLLDKKVLPFIFIFETYFSAFSLTS